jgi:hypothetical protein
MKSIRITVQAMIPDDMSFDDAATGFNAILEQGLACTDLDDVDDSEEHENAAMHAERIEFPMTPTEVVPA